MQQCKTQDRAYVNRPDEPIDPHNPFCNPTEEPAYTPDYAAIVPQIQLHGCRIPLVPSRQEAARIRHYYNIAGGAACADFALAILFSSLLTWLAQLLLRHIDAAALGGSLPQNYTSIQNAYFSDSSIAMGINLLAFCFANLLVFLIASMLSRLRLRDFFRDRDLQLSTLMRYLAIGLWIQLTMGYLVDCLQDFLARTGHTLYTPDFSTGDSPTKLLITVLYCCFVAPLTEELVFRGVVLKNLCRVSQRMGIFLSAFFFALAHENLPQGMLAFVLGIFLAYITITHNSLVPAIVVHFAVNLVDTLFNCATQFAPGSAQKVYAIYTLILWIVGTAALAYTLMTERLPATTPHQSFRGMRIALTAPGIWMMLGVHLISIYLPQLTSLLTRFFSKG